MYKQLLYVGSLDSKSNSYMRFNTLLEMGHSVVGINSDSYILGNIFEKFHYHFNIGPGINKLNEEVLKKVREIQPDILWLDNKMYLQPATLKKVKREFPAIKIIHLIIDDPTGKYKSKWKLALKIAPQVDYHFVQREVNIEELKAYGAKRVGICLRSFDPKFHQPLALTDEDKKKFSTTVGFVGTHESFREEFILYLIKQGIPVAITGNDWEKASNFEALKPFYKGPSVYGEDYIKTINGMDIALHFLRHVNRDEQDSRTFEIPACGTFMLAEKSNLHLRLFEDGKEAVFFETKEELLEKLNYYLKHVEERNAIAKAGYLRSNHSGYTHEARLKSVLNTIKEELFETA